MIYLKGISLLYNSKSARKIFFADITQIYPY